MYVAGYPAPHIMHISEAAKELGVNLSVEFHGCIVVSVEDDKSGIPKTDADVKALAFKQQNEIADAYYSMHLGVNWKDLVKQKAIKLMQIYDKENPMPF